MDRVFRQSNDRLDNTNQPTTRLFNGAIPPPTASVNERFLAYLEQVYAPRNPRRLLAVTVAVIGSTCLVGLTITAVLRQTPGLWLLLLVGVLLVTKLVLSLYHRLATRHRLLRVRDTLEQGVPVTGHLVRPPDALLRPGTDNLPVLALFSFQPEVGNDTSYMRYLVQRLHTATTDPSTPEQRYLAAIATAEPGVVSRRRLLPFFLTDGSTVYCADVWINRAYVRDGYLSGGPLPLLAVAGESGGVELVPWWLAADPCTLPSPDACLH